MWRFLLLILFGSLVVAGCARTLDVVVTGRPAMNEGGHAALVKIYQLRGPDAFRSAPLSSFWRDDTKALGSELVGSPYALTVYPDTSTTAEIEVADDAAYLAVAANLRTPDRDRWRSLLALDEIGDRVTVTVQRRQVAVEAEGRTVPRVDLELERE
jgi:type VI secretion system VasD/TssJ family lipoprotein